MLRRLAYVALASLQALVLASCQEVPTSSSGDPPLFEIKDALHNDGNEHFFWLPPMVGNPASFNGDFDGGLSPIVRICDLADCENAVIAEFSTTTGPGSETVRVVPEEEHYIVNWHTSDFAVSAGPTYRIFVFMEATAPALGHADVQLAATGKEVKNLSTDEIIGLLDGRTLPIKFRVEEGTAVEDLVPPEIVALSISQEVIDVSFGPQDVTFTMRITDALSGFDFGTLAIVSPSGNQSLNSCCATFPRISGNAQDGVYEVTFTLPQYSEMGVWHVNSLLLMDAVSNRQVLDQEALEARELSTGFEVKGVLEDLVPPEIVALSISQEVIDVSFGPQDVTFTMRITDALSGFDFGTLVIVSPSGGQSKNSCCATFPRISGNAQDGVYEVTFTLEQGSEAGVWHVNSVLLMDAVANRQVLDQGALEARELPTGFTVEGGPDLEPPEIVELTISPEVINVSSEPQDVTFAMRITDALSGFDFGTLAIVSPSGNQSLNSCCATFPRISGDAQDGVYEVTFTLEQGSEAGLWYVNSLLLMDGVSNQQILDKGALEARGLPTGFTVTYP